MNGMHTPVISKTLTPEQIKALLIRTAWLTREEVDITCLSEDLNRAIEQGLDAGLIDLRKSPDGYYSQNIDEYTSLLVFLGYAERRSPLHLTARGHKRMQEMVNEAYSANRELVQKWAEVLNADLDNLLNKKAD